MLRQKRISKKILRRKKVIKNGNCENVTNFRSIEIVVYFTDFYR